MKPDEAGKSDKRSAPVAPLLNERYTGLTMRQAIRKILNAREKKHPKAACTSEVNYRFVYKPLNKTCLLHDGLNGIK